MSEQETAIILFKRVDDIVKRIHDFELIFKPDSDVILSDPENRKEHVSVKGMLSNEISEYLASDANLLQTKKRIQRDRESTAGEFTDATARTTALSELKHVTDQLTDTLFENKRLRATNVLRWANRLIEEGVLVEGPGTAEKLNKCSKELDIVTAKCTDLDAQNSELISDVSQLRIQLRDAEHEIERLANLVRLLGGDPNRTQSGDIEGNEPRGY